MAILLATFSIVPIATASTVQAVITRRDLSHMLVIRVGAITEDLGN